jgi:HK97 family phage portal protein
VASVLGEIFAGPPPVQKQRGFGGGILSMVLDQSTAEPQNLKADPSLGLGITTAWACVRLISGVASSLPVKIVKRGDKARVEVRTPEFGHIWGKPNPAMEREGYWESLIVGALTYGNAHSWKDRTQTNQAEPWRGIKYLWPLHPARVKTGMTANYEKVFQLDRKEESSYSTMDIGHVPLMSLDGIVGLSPIQQNAAALGLAQAQERFGASFFSRGQQVSGILSSDQVIDQDQAEDLQKRWIERHAGPANSMKPVVMGRGVDWKPIALAPDEAQFIESRGYQREEIIQIYGVPPHMIGLVEKSTSWGAGVEWQYIGFVVTCLVPLLNRFEQWVGSELLPGDLQFKFGLQGLLRGDSAGRAELYSKLRGMGVMSADGILELEDLPPRGIQDDYLSPINMERLGIPGSGPAPRIMNPAAPPAPGRPVGSERFGMLAGAEGTFPGARDGQDLAEALTAFLLERSEQPPARTQAFEDEAIPAALSERMAQSFLEGESYGQIAIKFAVEGVDPVANVKARLRRHFGGSPLEARAQYAAEEETPPRPRVTKTVERDADGRIARVIEETING